MTAIETLISVLCGPDGKCCISGSDDDRRLIDSALADLAQAAQQVSTVTNYTTLGTAMRAIRQSIQMIGDPEDECMRAVKRVLRGAVIIVEDSGDEVAAPAAPALPAAPQGVAYAALPEPYCNAHDDGDACYPDMFSEHQMHAFADATHTLRASHGQAPVGAAEEIDKALNVYAQAFAARVNGWTRQNGDDLPGARSALFAAIHAYARASTQPSPTA